MQQIFEELVPNILKNIEETLFYLQPEKPSQK